MRQRNYVNSDQNKIIEAIYEVADAINILSSIESVAIARSVLVANLHLNRAFQNLQDSMTMAPDEQPEPGALEKSLKRKAVAAALRRRGQNGARARKD
jgi:hypothetical protein